MARWRRRNDNDYDTADWSRDVADSYHDYADDWTDRFDDTEGSVRNAFSSLFGNRGGRGRYEDERPPRAVRRGVSSEQILEQAGFYDVLEKVEELTKKVEALIEA